MFSESIEDSKETALESLHTVWMMVSPWPHKWSPPHNFSHLISSSMSAKPIDHMQLELSYIQIAGRSGWTLGKGPLNLPMTSS